MARLGDICEVLNGYAFKSEKYTSSGVRIIRIANVQKGYIEDTAPAFYPIDTTNIEKYTLYEDDLLISLTGNVGRVALLKKEFLPAALNQRVACLRLKDSAQYDKSFLYCFLNSDYFENKCIQSAKGVAQKNMSTEWLKEYQIPNLSLVEQKEIAAVLNKISELISARTMQLQKLDELVKSRFIEMFGNMESNPKGWRQSTLGDECYYIKDGPHKSPKYLDSIDGIPFISTRNVVSGDGIDWSTAKYISEADYLDCIKKCHPEKGDILYSKGGTTGIAKLVDTDIRFANWVHVAVLKFGAQLDGRFLECMLNMNYCYAQSQALTKGIANKDFVLSAIAQVKIYVPPIELQRKYTEFVKRTDKSKLAIQQSLEKLETLKKALMQQYFG